MCVFYLESPAETIDYGELFTVASAKKIVGFNGPEHPSTETDLIDKTSLYKVHQSDW